MKGGYGFTTALKSMLRRKVELISNFWGAQSAKKCLKQLVVGKYG